MKVGLGDVQETLLIPLWARAIEAGKANPHFLTKNEGSQRKWTVFPFAACLLDVTYLKPSSPFKWPVRRFKSKADGCAVDWILKPS